MPRVAILGGGRVGRVIARDLSEDSTMEIMLYDSMCEKMEDLKARSNIKIIQSDLSTAGAISKAVRSSDIAIGALPGHMGFKALKEVLLEKKPYVDISFMPENPMTLHNEAVCAGIPVIYDFGVAPGMSNFIAASQAKLFDSPERIVILVGGLPRKRSLPWEYEAPFSPADVIEEYLRPARIRRNGTVITLPALSETETVEFGNVGTLEAFLTDGLRSIADFELCPNIEEKTLRYPGYRDRMKLLIDTGLLSDRSIEINGTTITPLQVTSKLLEKAWRTPPVPDEFTIMQIRTEGRMQGRFSMSIVNLFDETDKKRNETSMARTTGFPAAATTRALLNGILELNPGIYPPESLADYKNFKIYLFEELHARGIKYTISEQQIEE